MKRELKKCPFCGGEFKFDEAKEREYAESRLATGNGYAISAECEKCGCTVYAYDHKVADPANVDQVIDLLCEKINRREGEKELIRTIETLQLDNAFLEDKAGDEKGRADALEKENARIRNAIVESFINRAVTA